MRSFLLILTVILLSSTVEAQTTEDSVKQTINKLFEGMKTADVEMMKGAFATDAILQTISEKDGKVTVRSENVSQFAEAIKQIQKGDADEQIVYETVKIDANLAIAWTPYKFYYKGNFSHYGVNSFQLVRINGEWKIQYLIDTRRKKDCK